MHITIDNTMPMHLLWGQMLRLLLYGLHVPRAQKVQAPQAVPSAVALTEDQACDNECLLLVAATN